MAGNCSIENCYPDETGCHYEGCDILTECKYYSKHIINESKSNDDKIEDNQFIHIPWTGNTLGLQDLGFISSTSPICLIAIAGVASAGKTTFLATLYCLLRQGASIGNYRFAGSLTLVGWENIAWYLSWKQNNNIQFPPHTSSNAGRIPGLLHISLRNENGKKKEMIFTDAPGEWFDYWATNVNDPNATGAKWIHNNADAFLLFADCEMLSGNQLGKARQQTKSVADRLKQGLNVRPLGLIWSKSDIVVDDEVKSQISGYVQNSDITHYKEFETSVRNEGGNEFHNNVLESIEWIINKIDINSNSLPDVSRFNDSDMFLSKR